MSKKVHVDQEECIGCGLCEQICPSVFEMRDDGKSWVKDGATAPDGEIQQAIDSCPVQSIKWIDK